MNQQPQKLTPEVYRRIIGDQKILSEQIILTPVEWIAKRLAGSTVDPESWESNDAKIYRDVVIGGTSYDIVQCLPGASMALITFDEAREAGAQKVVFIGTCSSVEGVLPYGELYLGSNIVSVLNPFDEHEEWDAIKHAEVVDMEAKYLIKHALKRGVSLRTALIVTDAIWQDRWEQALFENENWKATISVNFEKLKIFLA